MLEYDSISSVAKKKDESDIFSRMPIYTHWLAMSIYDVLQSFKAQLLETPSELKVQFEGKAYEIKYDLLKRASDIIECAAKMGTMTTDPCIHGIQSSKSLRMCELITLLYNTIALEKLCFGQNFNASIVHQGPVRKKPRTQGNPDTADMLAVKVLESSVLESFYLCLT